MDSLQHIGYSSTDYGDICKYVVNAVQPNIDRLNQELDELRKSFLMKAPEVLKSYRSKIEKM
jgi:hypothetical protein